MFYAKDVHVLYRRCTSFIKLSRVALFYGAVKVKRWYGKAGIAVIAIIA